MSRGKVLSILLLTATLIALLAVEYALLVLTVSQGVTPKTITITHTYTQYVTTPLTRTKTIEKKYIITITKTRITPTTMTIIKTPFNIKFFKYFSSKLLLIIKNGSLEIGRVEGWLNITPYTHDVVKVFLKFKLPKTGIISRIGLLVETTFISFDGAYPPPPIPVFPPEPIYIEKGGEIVVLNRTYNMGKYVIPGFFIAYSIQAVQLTLHNNETILLWPFVKGEFKVIENATLDDVPGLYGGIHPLWEDRHTGTMEFMELRLLNGVTVDTLIQLDLKNGKYQVQIKRSISYP